jgi:hypothetical protein
MAIFSNTVESYLEIRVCTLRRNIEYHDRIQTSTIAPYQTIYHLNLKTVMLPVKTENKLSAFFLEHDGTTKP